MKVFKVIFNILQGIAAGYFCYGLYVLVAFIIALGGGSDPITLLLNSIAGVLFLLGALLLLNSIIGIFATKTSTVKTLSFINLIILVAVLVISNFNFDLAGSITCGIIALGNISLISLYNNKEKECK